MAVAPGVPVAVEVGLIVAVAPGVAVAMVAVGDAVAVTVEVAVAVALGEGEAVAAGVVAPGVPEALPGATILKFRAWIETMTLAAVAFAITGFGAAIEVAPVAPVAVGGAVAPGMTVTVTWEISGRPVAAVSKSPGAQAGRMASKTVKMIASIFAVLNVGLFIGLPP